LTSDGNDGKLPSADEKCEKEKTYIFGKKHQKNKENLYIVAQ
jgi:hypothetical protein